MTHLLKKIRKYRPDYNNNPPSVVSFIPSIPSTSGRLHSEFIRLLFLQSHRETDCFFATSGVQFAQSNCGPFAAALARIFPTLDLSIEEKTVRW